MSKRDLTQREARNTYRLYYSSSHWIMWRTCMNSQGTKLVNWWGCSGWRIYAVVCDWERHLWWAQSLLMLDRKLKEFTMNYMPENSDINLGTPREIPASPVQDPDVNAQVWYAVWLDLILGKEALENARTWKTWCMANNFLVMILWWYAWQSMTLFLRVVLVNAIREALDHCGHSERINSSGFYMSPSITNLEHRR